MKMTRRMTAFTVILALLAMMLMPASAAGVKAENPYEIRNDEARRLYNALVEASQTERVLTGELSLQTSSVTRGMEDETRFTDDFEALSLAVGDEEDKQIIYDGTEGSAYTVIEYNAATGAYALMEASTDSEDVLYMVDGEAFLLVMDGENVNMVSESGETLPLIEVEYITAPSPEDFPGSTPAPAFDPITFGDEFSVLSTTDHRWSDGYGPYYRTDKQWCDVLGIVGFTASVVNATVAHPVLGVIVWACAVGTTVGMFVPVTYYIRYYTAYDLNDMYWTKITEYWYEDSNYTELVRRVEIINYDDTPW